MQDHFLFDDNDARQRGKGCDKLGHRGDGLALIWTWERYGKKGKPSQTCYAEIGKGWCLKVIFWHTNYEARVEHVDSGIRNYNVDVGDDKRRGKILVTRLQAQLKAEELVIEVWKELDVLIQKKGIFAKRVVRVLIKGKE